MACNGGGPPMNTDISGIGVRVSFYLQTLFLSGLTLRSRSLDEIASALYTLIVTNTAMAATALILGLKPTRGISFQDGLIVFYLLFLSWITVLLAIPACAQFKRPSEARSIGLLDLFSAVQSYTVFAFALVLFSTAPSFGSSPSCNPNAVVVLFRPIHALHSGRIVGLVVTILLVLVYTALLVKDHIRPEIGERLYARLWVPLDVAVADNEESMTNLLASAPQTTQERRLGANASPSWHYPSNQKPQVPLRYHHEIWGKLLVALSVVLVLWALAVMNTELLIRWNNFAPSGSSPWQFGQILPMFLVILPFANLVKAFRELRLKRPPPVPRLPI